MSITNVRELLSLHEGRVPHAYLDSLGFWTIGVGHLIDKRKGGKLPEHIIDALLDHDIAVHTEELIKGAPFVANLDPVRQAVLIDMYFNLGPQLLGWKFTLGAAKDGRYEDCAQHMLDSQPWASQVKSRATRLAEMMRTGRWPE